MDARGKGNVARSTDLNAAGHMLAAATAIYFFGETLTHAMAELLQSSLRGPALRRLDRGMVAGQFWQLGEWAVNAVLPWLALMVVAALFVNVVQVGFILATEAIQPKLSRLSPLAGAKRIVSVAGLVRLATSLGKLTVLVAIAAWFIASRVDHCISLNGEDTATIMTSIGQSLTDLAFLLALALIVLALLDFVFQKWKHEQDLKMTKQEVREEMKNMDGDPQIRQRRREAHRKLAQARELHQVQDADVVITNPTHISVALKYDPDTMPAPTVIAKGMGEIAARIREIAAQHAVPIIERKELARSLYRTVNVGQTIPAELYGVFVEIMAYIYRLTGRRPSGLT